MLSVESVMKIGSPILELQAEAVTIHEACREAKIPMRVEWLSRSDARMEEADTTSRCFDLEEFGLEMADFDKVLRWYGSIL